MDLAYAHLSSHGGWRPISEGGPQLLPPSNGAVRAFKFRDPDGHPLELIWFPPGQGRAVWHQKVSAALFLGIDHSALSVASTPRSLAFYRALGLRVSERSVNWGPAQERLDGVPGARVRVTSLRPVSAASLVSNYWLIARWPCRRDSLPERLGDGLGHARRSPFVRCFIRRHARPRRSPICSGGSGCRRDWAAGMRPDHMAGGEWVPQDLADRQRSGASTIRPRPPTRAKFFKNSQKCSSPSPSLKRQKSGKRQNW